MDAISDRHRSEGVPGVEEFITDLEQLESVCRWTDGYWDFGPGNQRKWNELQNMGKEIQLLSNYLLIQYRHRVWDHVSTCMREDVRKMLNRRFLIFLNGMNWTRIDLCRMFDSSWFPPISLK